MHRICFLIFVLNAMAFEDSDEAKYIDLLPESEKQEFLNRIARRILEEIQSKESPEQSHVEVTDDQLNAHDAYVQDLLKEESENHRNERRVLSEREDNGDELKSKAVNDEVKSPQENSENRLHIDLTYNQQEDNENKYRRVSDSNQQHNDHVKTDYDSLSVIPVEVVNDNDDNKNAEDANNNSPVFSKNNDDITSNNNDNGRNSSKNSSQEYKSPLDQDKNIVSTENYQVLAKSNSTNVLEKDFNDSFNNMKVLELDSTKLSSKKPANTNISKTYNEEENQPDIKMISEMSNENYDDSHKQFQFTSTTRQNILNISKEESSFVTVTTELSSQSHPNKQDESQLITSTLIEKTTVENITVSPKIDSNETLPKEDNANLSVSGIDKKEMQTKDVSKTINNTNKESETLLRKRRLQIMSADYSIEEEPYKNSHEQTSENIQPKKYVVYEVSKENPTFIKTAHSKKDEQPYNIPIYKFGPKNAYYNAYNNLGPNNDDEAETFGRSLNNNEDELELHSRSGFKIDVAPKNPNFDHNSDKLRPKTEKYDLSKLNQDIGFLNDMIKPKYYNMYKPNFDMDYYYDIEDRIGLNREYINNDKGAQRNFKNSGPANVFKTKYTPDFDMDYYDIFDPRRKSKSKKAKRMGHKNVYHGGKLPDSGEKDHPYTSIYKDNMKDHVRAVRKLLYLQKEFGFLSPTPYNVKVKPRRNRAFGDDLGLNNDITTRRTSKKDVIKKKISLDYYWGRINQPIDIDFDDDELNDINTGTSRLKEDNIETKNAILKSILNSLRHSVSRLKVSKSVRDNFDIFSDALINVLKDMIYRNSETLVSYDWLSSTVDIRGALVKLLELIDNAENKRYIHPSDLKLLNYVLYLYDTSSKILEDTYKSFKEGPDSIRPKYDLEDENKIVKYSHEARKFNRLPQSKKKKLGLKIKNPLNLWQNWYKYYVRVLTDENNKNAVIIKKFKQFLRDLEDNLYGLHIALKHIASITTFTDQNWYEDLSRIFLNSARKKHYLQVLLHLSTYKLFNSIEKSTKNGAEDYVYYVKNNREVIRRILNEFVFVLRVLDRLKTYS